MSDYSLEFYRTRRGDCPASEFVDGLNDRAQGKIARWLTQLKQNGPDLRRPMADVLSGPIRELRIGFGRDQYRLLFFIHAKTIVITHGFRKKSWAVDPMEIEKAGRYMADWLEITGGSYE